MSELVGPLPKPVDGPKYPTPWGVMGSVLQDANGKEIMSGASGDTLALWGIIAEAINEKYKTEEDFEYYIREYATMKPDYLKVHDRFVVSVWDSEDENPRWDVTRKLFQDDGMSHKISYQDLPPEAR